MLLLAWVSIGLLVVLPTIVRGYDDGFEGHVCDRVEMEAVRSFMEYSKLMQKHHKRVIIGLGSFSTEDQGDFALLASQLTIMLSKVSKRTRGVYGCGSVALFAYGKGSGFQGLMTKAEHKVFLWGARTPMEAVSEPALRVSNGEAWLEET